MNQRRNEISINIFEQINSICKDFRRAWKDGKKPKIEIWVQKIKGSGQSTLFSNLLQSELRIREKMGDRPSSGEYIHRFPAFTTQVRQVFDESTMGSIDRSVQGTPGDSGDEHPTQTFEIPDANRLGDYELIRELGRGGMGVVYEARHRDTGNQVALKTLPTGGHGQEVNADKLYRFRKEFRRLSEINHPNLVGMQTLEVDGDQWFFTMDVIDGTDFLSYVRPGDQLDESRLRDALEQLARGVLALHRRGIIHRDLKPSNVLVADDGTVSILDFGLASEMQLATDMTQTKSGMFAGTPRYAAPEQMFGERTEASDWYALGTMLYEALTGAPPFAGLGQVELLRQKQQQEAASLSEHMDLPSDLAQLTDGLIRREPSQRMTVEAIGKFLDLEGETLTAGTTNLSGGSAPSQGSRDSSESIDDATVEFQASETEAELVLIGRDSQLAELEQARQQMLETGKPVLVWISGLSGEGKSSLCEKFLHPLRQGTEMLVLAGRCYDRESVPFKAVDSIVESLVSYLRSRHAKWLESEQPEDVEFLAAVFPLLRRVDWIARRQIQDLSRTEPQKIRGRAFYGLRQLLTAIGRRTPIVIHLDDLQWGDADSARAWQELLVHKEAPPLLILGSYRSDEAADSPFLETWKQLEQLAFHYLETRAVPVSALAEEQCLELVRQRTGLTSAEMESQVSQLFAETAGNPYFLDQLLEGFDSSTNTFRHVPLDEIIAGRLSRLPEAATRLLEVIAISGQPIRIDEASSVSEVGKTAAATLIHMRSERLVRLLGSGSDTLVETWHDKVREAILDTLSSKRKKQLHLKLAEEIEAMQARTPDEWLESLSRIPTPGEYEFEPSDRVLDLCQHFTAAGDHRAFVYQWLAGEQALQAYAFEEAERFFLHAQQKKPGNLTSRLMCRFWFGQGRVSLSNNRIEDAIDCYQKIINLSDDKVVQITAYAGLAAVYEQVARFDEAVIAYDNALNLLGTPRPSTAIGRLFGFVVNGFRTLVIPAKWQTRKTEHARQKAILQHGILSSYSHISQEKDFLSTLDVFTRASVVAFQTGKESIIADGHAHTAILWAVLGFGWFTDLCLNRSRNAESLRNNPTLFGDYLFRLGAANYWRGHLPEATRALNESVSQLDRAGVFYRRMMASHLLRHAKSYTGSTSSELAAANDVLQLANILGNTQCMCWGNYDSSSALARHGDLTKSMSRMKEAFQTLNDERYFLTEAIRASTYSFVLLQSSAYKMSGAFAHQAWEISCKSLNFHDPPLLCLPLLIEAISGPNWIESQTGAQLPLLKKMLRRGALLYRTLFNHQPHLQRVFGRAAASMGKRKKATRRFEKAVKLSVNKGFDYQRAKALLDLAAVKEENRQANRAEAIELLKKMESVIPRAESWLLGDQYDESVVAPEFDLAAWEAKNGPVTPYLDELEGQKE